MYMIQETVTRGLLKYPYWKGGYHGYGWYGWFGGTFWIVIFLVLLAVIIYFLVRGRKEKEGSSEETSKETLEKRYARTR